MQAVILAGGQGTRLRSRLGDLPKPLVTVCGAPLLQWQICSLRDQGIRRIVLLVNYQARRIVEFCAAHKNFDCEIKIIDDGEPLGTAGAALAVLDQLDARFFVVYGDTLFNVDFDRFAAFHAMDSLAAATLLLHPNDHPYDSDLVELDENGNIFRFLGHPHPLGAYRNNLVNAALYLVERDRLNPYRNMRPPLDFAKDLFPSMLANGALIRGYVSPEYIKDAGTPERLDRVEQACASGLVDRACLRHPQRAVFIDRDGTLNVNRDHISSVSQLEVFPFVGPALRRLNESEWRAVIVTNQPVLARGDCDAAGLRQIHAKLETEVAKAHAYFDRFYVCPHHPDSGFDGEVEALKISCDCRKPKAGLLIRAESELHIDLKSSWMVGDSTADMAAAKSAGVSSILVYTGAAGLDNKYCADPDFVVSDFSKAVDFILDHYPRLAKLCRPVIIEAKCPQDWFIGGLPFCGKSIVSSVLRRELRLLNKRCEIIRLDPLWSNVCAQGSTLEEKYGLTSIESAVRLAMMRTKERVNLGSAEKGEFCEAMRQVATKDLDDQTIVVWEGVAAFEVARRLGVCEHLIAVKVSEGIRRERLIEWCRTRGIGSLDAEAMYLQQERDGQGLVEQQANSASYNFELDAFLASR